MPLDRSLKKVLVIGAGPIVIGQACEFDYAGTQACTALKEAGCRVILLNSNPATIMTDGQVADAIYIEPITAQTAEAIIRRERPDAILATMGGQTALNCARELAGQGILQKYGVRLLGITPAAIEKAENRHAFKQEMLKIGVAVPKSYCVANWQEALSAQRNLSFPLIVRSSYTLGGQGSGIARDMGELESICQQGPAGAAELLLEESVIGWKEYELEIVRDSKGTSIVVCGIENIDPMGVHTGDSMAVSPIQTLTDKEYQQMRKSAFQIVESIGMVAGGCNVQFAVHPKTGRMLCIEVNPRVSRSSALASKATGFPIAKIAAKLAIGFNLDELKNDATCPSFPAAFEPVMDYVVVKIPRFNFEKFPQADQLLCTHMKSVGEVMGIGRTFKEALHKAIASLELQGPGIPRKTACADMSHQLKLPVPQRLGLLFEALCRGMSIEEAHALTHYDPWFLAQFSELVEEEKAITASSLATADAAHMRRWKRLGFSDDKLAALMHCTRLQVAEKRRQLHVHPVYKRIDTCSAEFPSDIPYMYSTYEDECESTPTARQKVLVIGSGPNRIGQGIEFDYCCVQTVKTIRELGYESILVNCNPATVSTDYDIADRLYFEPLTPEHVQAVMRTENPRGTIIQFGGQTPLNIARHLQADGIMLLGTPFAAIEQAEDKQRFRLFVDKLGLKQPPNAIFNTEAEALQAAPEIGFPMILRPSYVIGGHAIEIVCNAHELQAYLQTAPLAAAAPVLMERFLEGAKEVEVDAICDGTDVCMCGILEHVEPAGVHSGDSMSFLSPYQLDQGLQAALMEQTKDIGLALGVVGCFNVQFAIHHGELLVLEVNPRASRTVPLLSKTTGMPLVRIATKCILGQSLKEQGIGARLAPRFLGLKLPVFPFARLQVAGAKLSPQMRSTGEVLCIGKTFDELFIKARAYASQDKSLFTADLDAKLPRSECPPALDIYDIASTSPL